MIAERWRLQLLAAGALAVHATSCASRTLPLPPPYVDSVSAPNAQGLALVRGNAQEGAWVGVINQRTMEGTIVTSPDASCDSDCPFQASIAAESGDDLLIWQFVDTSAVEDRQVP